MVIAGELRVPQVSRPDCADAGGEFFEHLDVLMQLLDAGAIPTAMDMTFESIDFWRAHADEILKAHPIRGFTDRRSC